MSSSAAVKAADRTQQDIASRWQAARRGWLGVLLWPRRRSLIGLFLLAQLGAVVALVPPYLTKLIIDDGLLAGQRAALVQWSLVLFVVGLGSLLLGVLSSLWHMRASVGMLAALRAGLIDAIMNCSPAWRARHQTGELLSRLDGDAGEVQRFAFNALLTGSGSVLRLVGGAAMLLWLHWPLALLTIALAPFELWFLSRVRPRTEQLAKEVREARGGFSAQLAEMLAGLTSIQLIAAQRPMAGRLSKAQDGLIDRQLAAHRWSEFTRVVPQTLTAIFRAAIFLLGGLLVIDGELALGALVAFVGYIGFLIGPMQSLLGLWHAQARVKVAYRRLDSLMTETEREVASALGQSRRGGQSPSTSVINIQGLQLEAGERDLFAPLTAEILPGSKVLLRASSGAGKTSLLRAFSSVLAPVAGELRIGGLALPEISRDWRDSQIVHVPQRPFLIHASIADNLCLNAPGLIHDQGRMREVLTWVGLDQRVTHAGGVAAIIGEDGLDLSGGERQRLCLARALMRSASIYLFDEALSEVDPAQIARIFEQVDLHLAGSTRILTAHGNAAAFGEFDQIVELGAPPRHSVPTQE